MTMTTTTTTPLTTTPHPPTPLLLLSLWFQGSEFFSCRLGRYGPVYKTHLLGGPLVRVVGGDNVQRVLRGEHVTVRSSWPRSVRRLMGPHSLLAVSGDRHRAVRGVVAGLFTPTALASFVPRMQVGQSLSRSVAQLWRGY